MCVYVYNTIGMHNIFLLGDVLNVIGGLCGDWVRLLHQISILNISISLAKVLLQLLFFFMWAACISKTFIAIYNMSE